jgi:isocitrate dehydrogenase kinase/phosphatase
MSAVPSDVLFDRSMPSPARIAQAILDGFNRHYRRFRYVAQQAKQMFENGDWQTMRTRARERIDFYDTRVLDAVERIEREFDLASLNDVERDALWQAVKQNFVALLADHRQPECAETFFNSVCTKLLHRDYFRNQFIFVRPGVATDYMDSDPPSYRSYYPAARGLRRALRQIVIDFGLACRWENVERDIRYLMRALTESHRRGEAFRRPFHAEPDCQVQVLSSLFFRNKGAYIVGRVINGTRITPVAVPILRNPNGHLYLDTAIFTTPARTSWSTWRRLRRTSTSFAPSCRRSRRRSCTRWWAWPSRARRCSIATSCTTCATRTTSSSSRRASRAS